MRISSFLMCCCLFGIFGESYSADGWNVVNDGNTVTEIRYTPVASNRVVLPANATEYYASIFKPDFTDHVKVIDMSNLTSPVKVYSPDPEDYAYGVHVIAPSEEIARSWCGISEIGTPVADVVPLRGYENRWIIVPITEQIEAATNDRLKGCIAPFVFFGNLNHSDFVEHISRVDARVGGMLKETYMYNVIDLAREFTHDGAGFSSFTFDDLSERVKLINALCAQVKQMDNMSMEKKKFIVSELCRSVAYTYDVFAAYSNGFTSKN